MTESRFHILGIDHLDDQIHADVQQEADRVEGPDVIYHEKPESKPSRSEYVFWILRKDPTWGVLMVIYSLASLIALRDRVTIGVTASGNVKTECRVAAEELEEKYDVELVDIGMNRVDLLKERSWVLTAVSMGIVVFSLWYIFSASPDLTTMLARIVVPGLIGIIYLFTVLSLTRDTRDEHMATTALSDYRNRDVEVAFVIVGENHIEGVASWLGAHNISPICRWISSETELESRETLLSI